MKKYVIIQIIMFMTLLVLILIVQSGAYTYNQTRYILYGLIIVNGLGSAFIQYRYLKKSREAIKE